MTRPRTVSVSFSSVSHIGCSSSRFDEARMHPQAFPKRSLSARLAQQGRCCMERGDIMAGRNGPDDVPELVSDRGIGKSTGDGVQRRKLQPARRMLGGELVGIA